MEKRYCKYCNEDISNKKKDSITCGKTKCISARDKETRGIKKDRKCEVCGDDISSFMGKRKICNNEECKKEQVRRKYKDKKVVNVCIVCNNEFDSHKKEIQCCSKECFSKLRSEITKNVLNTIQQQVICKTCNKLIRIQDKKDTKANLIIYEDCDVCKIENRKLAIKKMSDRMKSDENPAIKLYGRREYVEPMTKEEFSEFISKRMKENNPMFNQETRDKVSKTIKSKIESGEIVYKKGKRNSRNLQKQEIYGYIRICLIPWIKECMIRDNYTCQECGKNKCELQVHHKETFIDILRNQMILLNMTDDIHSKYDYDNEMHILLLENVIKYHTENHHIGITVCPDCHSKIDSKYRRYKNKKYENNKNNKD